MKISLIKLYPILFLVLSILIVGCKSEEETKEEIKNFIEVFIQDARMRNSDKVEKAYPGIVKIGEYWTPEEFTVTQIERSGRDYNVYGQFIKQHEQKSKVMFTVREEGGSYRILSTKGLSVYTESPLWDFLTRIGCLNEGEDDKDIATVCNEKEGIYHGMMLQLKEEIQNNITIDNTKLSINGGYYLSGIVVVTNNTRFAIPANSYKVEMGFIDTRSKEGIDKQAIEDFYPSIAPYSSISLNINYMPINGGNKVGGLFSFRESESLLFMLNEDLQRIGVSCEQWSKGILPNL
jgi:hypothetical protein